MTLGMLGPDIIIAIGCHQKIKQLTLLDAPGGKNEEVVRDWYSKMREPSRVECAQTETARQQRGHLVVHTGKDLRGKAGNSRGMEGEVAAIGNLVSGVVQKHARTGENVFSTFIRCE